MTLVLSFPPSVNNLFLNTGKGRVRSPRYRAWARQAALEIMIQRPAKVLGPYHLTIVATRPDNRARDLANLEKAISDALVTARVIEDDSLAESIFMQWSAEAPRKGATVRVEVTPDIPAQAEREAA